jgi:hypothetical protein
MRAMVGEVREDERNALPRPRVIFSTRLRRDDPFYGEAAERVLNPTS